MSVYEPCTFIVGYKDPNESITEDIIVIHSRQMHTALGLWSDLPVVDYRPTPRVFKSGDILFIDWIPQAVDTLDFADSTMMVPVTFKNLRTGKYDPAYIEITGKYKWTTSAVAGADGVRAKCCRYIIPDGMTLVLGHRRSHNSRLLLDPMDDT